MQRVGSPVYTKRRLEPASAKAPGLVALLAASPRNALGSMSFGGCERNGGSYQERELGAPKLLDACGPSAVQASLFDDASGLGARPPPSLKEGAYVDGVFLPLRENVVQSSHEPLFGGPAHFLSRLEAAQQHDIHGSTAAWFGGHGLLGVSCSRFIARCLLAAPDEARTAIFGAQPLDVLGNGKDASWVDLVISEKLGKLVSHVSSWGAWANDAASGGNGRGLGRWSSEGAGP